MNAEDPGSFGLISSRLGKCGLDESFFEFAESFIKVDFPFDHFSD